MCGKRHKCSFSRLEVVLIVLLALMIAVTVALLVLHFLTQENSSSNGKLSYFGTAHHSSLPSGGLGGVEGGYRRRERRCKSVRFHLVAAGFRNLFQGCWPVTIIPKWKNSMVVSHSQVICRLKPLQMCSPPPLLPPLFFFFSEGTNFCINLDIILVFGCSHNEAMCMACPRATCSGQINPFPPEAVCSFWKV